MRGHRKTLIAFTIYGEIPSQKNILRVSRTGHFFHANDAVRQYQNLFALQCPARFKRKLPGPVAVELRIFKKDNRRDGCNMGAAVYDALQSAGVILNDRQVVERREYDFIDKENPRVEIQITEAGPGGLTLPGSKN